MSDPIYSSLIDFSKLSKVLNDFDKNLKKQEIINQESSEHKKETSDLILNLKKDIKDIQTSSKTLETGLNAITKIEEKLSSWSERFRSLEESNYTIQNKIKTLEDYFEQQLSSLKSSHSKDFGQMQSTLSKEIETKNKIIEIQVKNNFDQLASEVSHMKYEIHRKTEAKDFPVNTVENNIAPEKLQENLADTPVKATIGFVQNSGNSEVISRLFQLETQMGQVFSSIEKLSQTPAAQDFSFSELKKEIDDKMTSGLNEIKQIKSEINVASSKRTDEDKNIKRMTSLNLGSEFKGLKRKLSLLDVQIEEIKKRNSVFELSLPYNSPPSPHISQEIAEDESYISSNSIQDASNEPQNIQNLNEAIEKIQKAMPLLIYKSELEDILLEFSKKINDSKRKFKEVEDHGPKILEQEQRLNNIWRSHNEILEVVQQLQNKQGLYDEDLQKLQDYKLINVELKISSLENEMMEKIKEIKESSKPPLTVTDPATLQNEQYFRSMLLSLRNDINMLKEENSIIKISQLNTPIPLDNPLELEDIQEPLQIGMLQSILKQHDTAIRILANRTIGSRPDEKSAQISEATVHLSYLEDMKKEMKEILGKQEDTKKLSGKDLEVIHNILKTLDSKIGKEELKTMADKNELHKIYRNLKKRIDEIAEEVKRKENNSKEDTFFSKKKFDLECASCGQALHDKHDNKLVYENWSRFPAKNSTYGVGFSRILNSLVPSPTGGLMLAPKSESGELNPSRIQTIKAKTRKTSRVSTGLIKKII